jgi:hypothetical protein
VPAEWLGAASLMVDAAARLEWLAGARGDAAFELEFAGGVAIAVIGDSGLALEWGGAVRAEVSAAAELTGGVVTEGRFPAELLMTARTADAALPLAALLRVHADPPVAAEWLGQGATIADALVPVEIAGRVASLVHTLDETLVTAHARETSLPLSAGLTAGTHGQGPGIETTGLLLRGRPVSAESTTGLARQSAPAIGEWQAALARLLAALPAEWRLPALPLISLGRLLASIGKRRILKE